MNRIMNGPNCIEAQECRGDFWVKLEEAMRQAGGGFHVERMIDMEFKYIVDVLAQNGIRMIYDKKWHIDTLLNRS